MDAAVFAPIGGGRISKAEAFDVLAEKLGLEERPLSEIRRDVFRLVFDLGRFAFEHGQHGKIGLDMWAESFEALGGLYEGLAGMEHQAMEPTHKANLERYLHERSIAAGADTL